MNLTLYLVEGGAEYLQVCPDAPDADEVHRDARECPGHPARTHQRILVKAPDAARALQEAAKKLSGAYKWIIFEPAVTRVTEVATGESVESGPTLPGFGRDELGPGYYTNLAEVVHGPDADAHLTSADLVDRVVTKMAESDLPDGWTVDPATRTIHVQTK